MDNNEKKSVFNVFKAAPFLYMTVALGRMILNGLFSEQEGIVFTMLNALVSAFVSCGTASFHIHAIRRGMPDLKDLFGFVEDKVVFAKFLSIMLVYIIIEVVLGVVVALAVFIPFVNIIVALGSAFVMVWFLPVWYIFATNPSMETSRYFTEAKNRMKGHVIEYFAIIVIAALCIGFGARILGMVLSLLGVLGIILIVPLVIAASAIVSLVIADFMNNIIPKQWDYML